MVCNHITGTNHPIDTCAVPLRLPRGVQIIQGFVRHFTTSLQVRSTKLNSLNDLPILSLSSERFTADLIRALFYRMKVNTW